MWQEVDSRLLVFMSISHCLSTTCWKCDPPLYLITSAISLKSVQLFVYFWTLLAYYEANFSVACTSELKP